MRTLPHVGDFAFTTLLAGTKSHRPALSTKPGYPIVRKRTNGHVTWQRMFYFCLASSALPLSLAFVDCCRVCQLSAAAADMADRLLFTEKRAVEMMTYQRTEALKSNYPSALSRQRSTMHDLFTFCPGKKVQWVGTKLFLVENDESENENKLFLFRGGLAREIQINFSSSCKSDGGRVCLPSVLSLNCSGGFDSEAIEVADPFR